MEVIIRITSGFLGGRRLPKVASGVRPTQDRVREALFSSLAERVPEASFLDLYAGSGAVGLEAWSRGAAGVTWVERDRGTHARLAETVTELCGDEPEALQILRGDVIRSLSGPLAGRSVDVVFADPPYEISRDPALLGQICALLREHGVIADDGILVFEHDAAGEVTSPEGWSIVRSKHYGETRLEYLTPA